jgi:SAM-dependent methyltransferase
VADEKDPFRSVISDENLPPARDIDTSVPHIARIYNYWLGGKDYFAVDREAAEKVIQATPAILPGVRANRAFLGRAVRYLAAEAGIRQFLDIGTGIPSASNTHEVAQAAAPGSRVVYVDNDPIVLAHARALLTGAAGTTAYLDADVRDPATILAGAAATLDFGRPVAVMLIAIMHCVPGEDDPYRLVRTLLDAVPPGSYLVLSQPAKDMIPEKSAEAEASLSQAMRQKVQFRTHAEVSRFFDGLELLEPGVVHLPEWRPDEPVDPDGPVTAMWGGAGRKA